MAIYSVLVPKGSKKNFFDGIRNGIWGFISERKFFPSGQKRPEIGDYVVFAFAIHQSPKVEKGGFPRSDNLEQYLYHYKPYAERLTLSQITEIHDEPDQTKVIGIDGEEIWIHEESTPNRHKFPYRVKLKVLKTYDNFDFIDERLNSEIVEAFRLSSSDIGSLRFATSSNMWLSSEVDERLTGAGDLLQLEPKATSKLIRVEKNMKRKHLRKGTDEYIASSNEAQLVQDYCSYLQESGNMFIPQRSHITMPNGTNLYTDITIDNKLIEAKSSTSRNSIRMAIGQLYDYEFLLEGHYRKAILVPKRPEHSLCNLMRSLGFSLIYKKGSKFVEESSSDQE